MIAYEGVDFDFADFREETKRLTPEAHDINVDDSVIVVLITQKYNTIWTLSTNDLKDPSDKVLAVFKFVHNRMRVTY